MMARMASLYPRRPIDLGGQVRELPADGTIHVSLFRDADRTLIVGDAFCTTKQESFFAAFITHRPELHGPPAYFTTDWDAARDSVRRLASLHPACIAPGHGEPMAGDDTTRSLVELAERFDEVARPEHGRYVQNPRRE